MINYMVSNTLNILELLEQEERLAGSASKMSSGLYGLGGGANSFTTLGQLASNPQNVHVPNDHKSRVKNVLNLVRHECNILELDAANDRITRLISDLDMKFLEYAKLEAGLRVLREVFQDGLKSRYFYYYPVDKAKVLLDATTDWQAVVRAFSTVNKEAMCATDCYAIGLNNACIFHLMRIAEFGLRALAKERRVKLPRKKPLEWQDWQVIITAIGDSVRKIANKKRGPARDAALEFYHGALGQFEAFKDVYRNNVMHARKDYGMHEAASVLSHVREFMVRLSSRINENTTKQIKWGVRS